MKSEEPRGAFLSPSQHSSTHDGGLQTTRPNFREREREREGRARSLPHLRAARLGVSIATTGTLSRVLGARTGTGQRLASERAASLSRRKRVGAIGRVRSVEGWGTSGSGRVSRLPDGSSLTCEREVAGIVRPRFGEAARAPNRSASHGGSGEGAAGCVSRRRRAARACSSPRPYVRRRGGASASGTGKARVGPADLWRSTQRSQPNALPRSKRAPSALLSRGLADLINQPNGQGQPRKTNY